MKFDPILDIYIHCDSKEYFGMDSAYERNSGKSFSGNETDTVNKTGILTVSETRFFSIQKDSTYTQPIKKEKNTNFTEKKISR